MQHHRPAWENAPIFGVYKVQDTVITRGLKLFTRIFMSMVPLESFTSRQLDTRYIYYVYREGMCGYGRVVGGGLISSLSGYKFSRPLVS